MTRANALAAAARRHFEASAPFADKPLSEHSEIYECDLVKLFRGRLLLILGAGFRDKLTAELSEQGIATVSLNPNWANNRFRAAAGVSGGMRAAALGQQLPFADKTFGGLLACYSVPLYLPVTSEHYGAVIKETQRVLTDDGIALFAPAYTDQISSDGRMLERTLAECAVPGAYQSIDSATPVLALARTPEVLQSEPLRSYLESASPTV